MTCFDENCTLCDGEGHGTHLSQLDLSPAKWSNSLLVESRNLTGFPSGSVLTPKNNGLAVPTTPHLVHDNCYLQQPTDQDQHMTDVQNVGVELQPGGLSGKEGLPSTEAELEPPTFVSTPSSGSPGFQGGIPIRKPVDRRSLILTRFKEDELKLLQWAKGRDGIPNRPTFNEALDEAIEVINNIREVVNQQPLLLPVNDTARVESISDHKVRSSRARRFKRQLFMELSTYYPLSEGYFSRYRLLSEMMRDLDAHPHL